MVKALAVLLDGKELDEPVEVAAPTQKAPSLNEPRPAPIVVITPPGQVRSHVRPITRGPDVSAHSHGPVTTGADAIVETPRWTLRSRALLLVGTLALVAVAASAAAYAVTHQSPHAAAEAPPAVPVIDSAASVIAPPASLIIPEPRIKPSAVPSASPSTLPDVAPHASGLPTPTHSAHAGTAALTVSAAPTASAAPSAASSKAKRGPARVMGVTTNGLYEPPALTAAFGALSGAVTRCIDAPDPNRQQNFAEYFTVSVSAAGAVVAASPKASSTPQVDACILSLLRGARLGPTDGRRRRGRGRVRRERRLPLRALASRDLSCLGRRLRPTR